MSAVGYRRGVRLPDHAAARADAGEGRRRRCPRATAGCSSRSGTASGRSSSATATRCYIQSRDLKPLDRYFPELADAAPGRAARALRPRWRGRHRRRDGGARLRGAAAADPPGRVAGPHARRASRRPASSPGTCSRSATRTCARRRRPSGEPGSRPRSAARRAADPPDAGDPRPRARRRLVRPVRGRRPRRRRREAARRAVPAGQAGDAQDQAPAHGRLRRRRLPLAQERPGHAHRVAAARAVRRRGHAPPRRRSRRRSRWDRRAALAEELAAAARERARRPSLARVGGMGRGDADASGQRLPGATSAAGTAARTCRGSRFAPSVSPRSPTTTSRATGSGTATTFQRWRPDKPPEDCRYDQLEETAPFELARSSVATDDDVAGERVTLRPARRRRLDRAAAPRRARSASGRTRAGRSSPPTAATAGRSPAVGRARAHDSTGCSTASRPDVVYVVPSRTGRRRPAGWSRAGCRSCREAAPRRRRRLRRASPRQSSRAGSSSRVGYHRRALDIMAEVRARLADQPPELVVARWLDSTPEPAGGAGDQGGGQVVEQATHLYDLARTSSARRPSSGLRTRTRDSSPDGVDVVGDAAVLRFDSGAVGRSSTRGGPSRRHRAGVVRRLRTRSAGREDA